MSNLRLGTPDVHVQLRRADEYEEGDSYEMMHYNDDILAVHITNEDRDDSFVRFIRTTENLHYTERIVGWVSLNFNVNSSKLFVRHTAQYFCIGTHTGEGNDGHRKWLIKCYSQSVDFKKLEDQRLLEGTDALLIEDFHGNDVGSTVAFEIHGGYFYAVSNQGTYEVEEVDWTSFYHCVRFPLNNPTEEAIQKDTRVYRRQHAEGAIHDSWTDLTLQHDEETNDLFIVESRREWVGASSKQARTFYTSRISFATPAFTESSWDIGSSRNDIALPLPLPDDDILTTVLESSHSANYMPTPKQYSWTRHPEFPAIVSLTAPNPRSFILARTKFRAYNLSCSTFLDLVEDTQCCPNRSPAALPCLRLRIGSRRVAPIAAFNSWSYENGNTVAKYGLSSDKSDGERVQFEDKTQYRYTPIQMSPPFPSTCPCSARLHRIMNPDIRPNFGIVSGQKTITAICDERSVVYMVKPSSSYSYGSTVTDKVDGGLGTIVLVDFGRSSKQALEPAWSSDLQWDWSPAQEYLCKIAKCQ